jgi:hypothetical protein
MDITTLRCEPATPEPLHYNNGSKERKKRKAKGMPEQGRSTDTGVSILSFVAIEVRTFTIDQWQLYFEFIRRSTTLIGVGKG